MFKNIEASRKFSKSDVVRKVILTDYIHNKIWIYLKSVKSFVVM